MVVSRSEAVGGRTRSVTGRAGPVDGVAEEDAGGSAPVEGRGALAGS